MHTELIENLSSKNASWMDFASYMHYALYDSQRGYYTNGGQKIGARGDFITAPEISSLFGRTIARVVADLTRSGANILELGPGTGSLAFDILNELEAIDAGPQEYLLLEPSASLEEQQKDKFSDLSAINRKKVSWISELPSEFEGIILANEVFDALPVHLLSLTDKGWMERGVTITQGKALQWQDMPLADPELGKGIDTKHLMPPYVTEVCPAADGLIRDLARCLSDGLLLLIDYGYENSVYYHPDRNQGTLACHYKHVADSDPLDLTGLKDITAHVDFTRLANAGIDNGLDLQGYTTQADFLINGGITSLLEEIDSSKTREYVPAVSSVQKLISPMLMGDMFKVMCFSKGANALDSGFIHGDRRHKL